MQRRQCFKVNSIAGRSTPKAALLTTIAGLVVAIPSVFGYNFLLGKSKQLVTELENYASSLADRIELESK